MSVIANTPKPPYYAVIFTSLQSEDTAGYAVTAQRMEELAREQTGFLGLESAREGLAVTVSYWESLDAIAAWKADAEHAIAQERGREQWYRSYKTRIARVERDYGFETLPAFDQTPG
jgi:heme-degrading monooxygenase HmoA